MMILCSSGCIMYYILTNILLCICVSKWWWQIGYCNVIQFNCHYSHNYRSVLVRQRGYYSSPFPCCSVFYNVPVPECSLWASTGRAGTALLPAVYFLYCVYMNTLYGNCTASMHGPVGWCTQMHWQFCHHIEWCSDCIDKTWGWISASK